MTGYYAMYNAWWVGRGGCIYKCDIVRYMYLVRVTGSVVGLTVFWVGVLHRSFEELVLVYVMLLFYV